MTSRRIRRPNGGLTWTAPGDDGMCGRAERYDVRYSSLPLTEANWSPATAIANTITPQAEGATEQFTLTGLGTGTHYIGVRAVDNAGNVGALSNVVTLP